MLFRSDNGRTGERVAGRREDVPETPVDQKQRRLRQKRLLPLVIVCLLMFLSFLVLHQGGSASASSASLPTQSVQTNQQSVTNASGGTSSAGMADQGTTFSSATGSGQGAATLDSGTTASQSQVPLTQKGSLLPVAGGIFSPYTEVGASLRAINQDTGQKFFTLAFMLGEGCQASWDGLVPLSRAESGFPGLASDIQFIRSQGGDVKISFGGGDGQELAILCDNPGSLQAQYQAVISQYHLTYMDFDIEGGQEGNEPVYDRRNIALAALQKANPGLAISFTLPASPNGLEGSSIGLLKNAVSHGVNISLVNIMTMDYESPGLEMGQAAIGGANGLHNQLKDIFPAKSDSELWSMVGITPMIGQNDSAGEIFTLNDASTLLAFAETNHIGELSMWAIGRDNGNCAGSSKTTDTCSGIAQSSFAFSQVFVGFTTGKFPIIAIETSPTCLVDKPLNDASQPRNCGWLVQQENNYTGPPTITLSCSSVGDWLASNPQVYHCEVPFDGGTFYCNVPTDVVLQDATVRCAKTQGGKLLACEYTYLSMGDCNPSCDHITPTINPLTGVPTVAPDSGGTPVVCPVKTTTCTPPTAGATPDANDWLFGSTNGLLIVTSSVNTYGIAAITNAWAIAYGLAMALVAIPCVLGGLQIIRSVSGNGRADTIEMFSRIIVAVVAASLSLYLIQLFINLESAMVGALFAKIPAPGVVAFMPSANWSCNAQQFFGSIFNLTVDSSQHTAGNLATDTYLQDTYTITTTLIVNLSYYVLTLLSVLLAIQLAVRLALVNMYIIISPLTIICSALLGRDGALITRAWLRGFAALLFVQLVQFVILWVGIQFIPAAWMSGTGWLNELFARLIPITLLGLSLSAPRLFNVSVTGLLSTVSSSIGGAMTGVILIIRGI